MSLKAEQKQRSHATILSSAARILRERGIAGARVAEVMQGAGLTVGGFYAHFASKEALVDATLRRTGAELRERLFARLADKPAAARVEVVLKRYLSAAHRDAQAMGCPFPAVIAEIANQAPEHREVLGELSEDLSKSLEELMPQNATLSPRTLALGCVALMVGGLSLARALRGTPLSDEVLRACRAVGVAATRAAS